MQVYGPTLLHKLVATKEDLNSLVRCVDVMPDLEDMIDGATVILTRTQRGYVALHTYRAEVTSETRRWIDVTDGYGPADRHDSGCSLHCNYEMGLDGVEAYYTGYLNCWFTRLTSVPESGEHQYSIVVRKQGAYPETMSDGDVLFAVPSGTIHSDADPYRYDDKSIGMELDYYYRVFHIFASGWWSYADGPHLSS